MRKTGTNAYYFVTYLPTDFNGFAMNIIGSARDIMGVSVVSATGSWSGFDSGRLSFDASHIFINMQGLSQDANSQLVLGYTVAPEPGAFGLLGASLVALGLVRRRRTLAAA